MRNPIKTYQFWLKIIACALLIVFGLWILLDKDTAKAIVLVFTGLVSVLFGVIRFIPLIKTLKNGKSKVVSVVEIVLDLAVGAYLIFAGWKLTINPSSAFSKFNDSYYRFFIAFILYLRAVIYFMCTVLYKEETDKIKFWSHIILITVACLVCSLNDVTTDSIAIGIAVIAFIISLGLAVDGGVGYSRYRKMIFKQRNEQETIEEENEEIEVPINDEQIIEQDRVC